MALNIHGAYGRDYTSAEEALADWAAGKDFKVLDGPYCSVRDSSMIRSTFGGIIIWFDELRKQVIVPKPESGSPS